MFIYTHPHTLILLFYLLFSPIFTLQIPTSRYGTSICQARSLTRRWFRDLHECRAHFAWPKEATPMYQPQEAKEGCTMGKAGKVEMER